VTPRPPAAQTEIRPRPEPRWSRPLASVGDEPPAGGAERMAGAERAAADVDLLAVDRPSGVEPEALFAVDRVLPRLQRAQHLRGERLVDLVDVEVLQLQPVAASIFGIASSAPSAGPRACARGRRRRSGRRRSRQAPAGVLACPLLAGQQHAEAPSDSGVELPAVIVPSGPPNTGFSFASFSMLESGAGSGRARARGTG
jgi:hypothetical protein